jgi:hypothetical protein
VKLEEQFCSGDLPAILDSYAFPNGMLELLLSVYEGASKAHNFPFSNMTSSVPSFSFLLKNVTVHTSNKPMELTGSDSCQPSVISKTSSRYQQKQFHEEVHVYPGSEIANRSC